MSDKDITYKTVPVGPLKFDKEGNCIQLPKGWVYAQAEPEVATKKQLKDLFDSMKSYYAYFG